LAQQVKKDEISQTTRAAEQVVARNFIISLWESNVIAMPPRNLKSRKLAVSAPLRKITTFSKEEIQVMLKAADERTKLYLLLSLNCGFYAVDIGTLRQDEVDWDNGRIRRQRTKTRDRSKKVPEVDYLLWRQTFALLKQYRNPGLHHPELALVNEEGNPLWWEKENKEGKVCRNNTVKCCYFRLQNDDLKLPPEKRKSWKILRKTAASMLEDHETYGRYAEYFLGEVPRGTTSRHYVEPSTRQFDAALEWLGKQFELA
jgi:integrase